MNAYSTESGVLTHQPYSCPHVHSALTVGVYEHDLKQSSCLFKVLLHRLCPHSSILGALQLFWTSLTSNGWTAVWADGSCSLKEGGHQLDGLHYIHVLGGVNVHDPPLSSMHTFSVTYEQVLVALAHLQLLKIK